MSDVCNVHYVPLCTALSNNFIIPTAINTVGSIKTQKFDKRYTATGLGPVPIIYSGTVSSGAPKTKKLH